jgi:3-deoxy-D-manno-octulosonic-acid transferase
MRRVIDDLSLIIMQSEADAQRARKLGARDDRVVVCGNLKYDAMGDGAWGLAVGERADANSQTLTPNPHDEIERASSKRVIVAGSTSEGEEQLLLSALREVRRRSGLEDTRLVLAPRHPERFEEVASLIARSGFSFARRSQARRSGAAEPGVPGAAVAVATTPAEDVILLDSIGDLAYAYRFAHVVFVGGSLVPRGGHNIIEPAAFAKPIIVGRHTDNFREIVSDFIRANALVQITVGEEQIATKLASEFINLLSDRERAQAIGARALGVLLAHRGATSCTMNAIKKLLGGL